MDLKNGRLVAVVASVAMLAIVGGTVLALRQGPKDGDGATGPLTTAGSASFSPSASASTTPSTPGSPTSTAAPTSPSATPPAATGPAKVRLTGLEKLPRGRDPQVSYLSGRQVLGGAGGPVTIPGGGTIHQVARLNEVVFAVQTVGIDGTELVKVRRGSSARVEKIADVASMAVTDDAASVAYATNRRSAGGGARKGSTVYVETTFQPSRKLSRPDDWELTVLGYAGGKVYFRSQATSDASTSSLYAWVPGQAAATRIRAISSPTAVAADGSVVASLKNLFDYGSCSTVAQPATGRNLWRTCDYQVVGFSPTATLALGTPSYADGYAALQLAALDGRNGNLLREWQGLSFHEVRAEDDDHLLVRADSGPETKSAIIRCTVSSGQCERATAVTSATLKLGN